MEYTYRLLWRNDKPKESGTIAWHIRGIRTDGSFRGEIRFDSPNPDKRLGALVKCVIPENNLCRFSEILNGFSLLPVDDSSMKSTEDMPISYDGVLNRCTESSETILDSLVLYSLGDENVSDKARLFIELIEIMEKEVSKSYHKIGQG